MTGSSLAGNLTKIGHRSADVYRVTFPSGVDNEQVTEDKIYLVSVPNEAGIDPIPFDEALKMTAGGSHSVNYFGYKYTSADAAIEKAHKNDPAFADRFPGMFFASAKAKAEDATLGGGAIAAFEATHGAMRQTATPADMLFERNSLYFLIVNETGNVTITVRLLQISITAYLNRMVPMASQATPMTNSVMTGT